MKPFMLIKFIQLILFIFGLNFVWEILQMPLYKNHSTDFLDTVLVHPGASLGDVLIFVILYLLGFMVFRNSAWFFQKNRPPIVFSMICGFFIAVVVEKFALASGRWEYGKLMPIIPFIQVGLTPALQMIILPAIVIKIARKIYSQ